MQHLKRSIIERILQCDDERLLRMVAQILELENSDTTNAPTPSSLADLLNTQSGQPTATDQDLQDLQDDIDEVFG